MLEPEKAPRASYYLALVRDIDRGSMLTAIEHHLEPLGAEPDHEVLPVRDDGNSRAAGQRSPFPQLKNVFGDVRFLVLATVFIQPILGQFAVGSSGRSVDLDLGHSRHLPILAPPISD
jgi:hypothetical protein